MVRIILLVVAGVIIFSACTKEEGFILPEVSEYNQDVINYFKEVALGFEFGNASLVTRRWEKNMKIFVGGNPDSELLKELDRIIDEINVLSSTDFMIERVTDSIKSNYYVFFGSATDYKKIYPSQSDLVSSNLGLYSVYWKNSNEIHRGHMYVDITRASLQAQLHILREELTQSLGLGKDSDLYPESIFYQEFSTITNNFSQIDKDLIRLLYHPNLSVGLNDTQVEIVLKKILYEEQYLNQINSGA